MVRSLNRGCLKSTDRIQVIERKSIESHDGTSSVPPYTTSSSSKFSAQIPSESAIIKPIYYPGVGVMDNTSTESPKKGFPVSRPLTPVAPLTPARSLAGSVNSNLSPILTESSSESYKSLSFPVENSIPTFELLPASGSSSGSLDLEGKGKKLPVIPSFPPTRVQSPDSKKQVDAQQNEKPNLSDILEKRLTEEAMSQASVESAAESPEIEQQSSRWSGIPDDQLINYDVSNTGSEFHGSNRSSVIANTERVSSPERAISQNSVAELPASVLPGSSPRPIPGESQVDTKTDSHAPSEEHAMKLLEQEYRDSGINEYLAREEAAARTGNVDRKAKIRTKKSTGRDLREKGRLRGSVRNSEMADIVNPSGDEEGQMPVGAQRQEEHKQRDKVAEQEQIGSEGRNQNEGSFRRNEGLGGRWSNTLGHHRGRGPEQYRPYIYPDDAVSQGDVVDGLYIGRNIIMTPQHWSQQHPYGDILHPRFYYGAVPSQNMDHFPHPEPYPAQIPRGYDSVRDHEQGRVIGQQVQHRPYVPLQALSMREPPMQRYTYHPGYPQRSHLSYDEQRNEPQALPTTNASYSIMPSRQMTSSVGPLPGPIAFPIPVAHSYPSQRGGATMGASNVMNEASTPSRVEQGGALPLPISELPLALQPSPSSQISREIPQRGSSNYGESRASMSVTPQVQYPFKSLGSGRRTRSRSSSRSRSRERERATRRSKDRDRERGRRHRNSVEEQQRSEMDINEYKQTLHVSSENFEKIITDLEEMLTQALELAGRAVKGGSLAGGLGYSPSTRKDGGKLVKRSKSRKAGAPNQDANGLVEPPKRTSSMGAGVGKNAVEKERKDSLPTLYSTTTEGNSIDLRQTINDAVASGLGLAGSQSRLNASSNEKSLPSSHKASGSPGDNEAALGQGRVGISRQLSRTGVIVESKTLSMKEVLDAGSIPGLIRISSVNGRNPLTEQLVGASEKEVNERGGEFRELEDGGYHAFLKELAINKIVVTPQRVGSNGSGSSGTSGRGRTSPPYGAIHGGLRNDLGGDAKMWKNAKKRFTSFVMIWVLAFEWGIIGA